MSSDATPPCRVYYRDNSDGSDSLTGSTASTSFSERLFYETNMPEHSKRRVDLATAGEGLSGSRCLIENTDEANVVRYTHCLDRGTKDHILDALEFSWGMPYRTLNPDTRYNVFRLSSKFHELYGKKRMCILLPEEHIIQQYYDARNDPSKFPDINESSYKYIFLAHKDMVSVPIHRLTPHDNPSAAPPASAYAYFAHPYADFDPVISHVHPRFVIYDVGRKIKDCMDFLAFYRLYPNHAQALEMVVKIWNAWTKVKKNNQDFINFRRKPYTRDNVSSTSERTAPRRLFEPIKKRRNKYLSRASNMSGSSKFTSNRRVFPVKRCRSESPNEPPSRTRKRSKGGRDDNDGIWLDGETLREHDSKFSSKALWKHKKASISHWTKVISETGGPVEQAMDLDMTVKDEAQLKKPNIS